MDTSPDDLWVRDGRGLRDWILDLLGPDPAVRRRAENAVSAMSWGVPIADAELYRHLPPDVEGHRAAFGAEVARLLDDPPAEGDRFVRAALERIRADAREAEELFNLEDRYLDLDNDLEGHGAGEPDEAGRPQAEGQRDSLSSGSPELLDALRRRNERLDVGRLPNSFGTHTLAIVVECAGRVLARLPDVTRAALRDGTTTRAVATALGRIGPLAAAFAGDLITCANAGGGAGGRVAFPADVAAVGGNDPVVVRELLARLTTGEDAWGASKALTAIGPGVERLVPGTTDRLLAASAAAAAAAAAKPSGVSDADEQSRISPVVRTLAAIAPGRRDVFELVLAVGRPGPPVLRRYRYADGEPTEVPLDASGTDGAYESTFDWRMHWRAAAIDVLDRFGAWAGEAAAVLADAVDTFVEFDPDETYEGGNIGRILRALERLAAHGSAAAGMVGWAAAGRVAARLRDDPDDVNWQAVRFLGRLGPAAQAALPALDALARERGPVEDPAHAGDEDWDLLGWAIARIRRDR